MNASDIRAAMQRAMPVPRPVPAMLIPEDMLKVLATAARAAVFEVNEKTLVPSEQRVMRELDRASEPFADMLDLDAFIGQRSELADNAVRVSDWLDGGCVTFPPIQSIKALVDALI